VEMALAPNSGSLAYWALQVLRATMGTSTLMRLAGLAPLELRVPLAWVSVEFMEELWVYIPSGNGDGGSASGVRSSCGKADVANSAAGGDGS
jgi:hypothetical protein